MTVWLILAGIAGGLIGGMGMGGGTLLIPLLTLLCGVEQHIAQAINLVAFVPMSILAIIIHAKNGLIKAKYFWWVAVSATVISILASLLIKNVEGDNLSSYFGYFLTVLGVYQLISAIRESLKKKEEK